MSEYHEPVMLQACLDGLEIQPEENYVDATFGGGGHSKAIIERLASGRLIGFDQDEDAVRNELKNENFTLIHHNFKYLKNYLRLEGVLPVSGILADLGVSSHQFNTPNRGFSFRFDAPLDMRMSQGISTTAKDILHTYDHGQLAAMFNTYGELRNAGRVAGVIVDAREHSTISNTAELKEVLKPITPHKKSHQFLAQVFQALRIEVNDEMGALRSFLNQSVDCLKKGGRLVIISYHSLEDRLVKNFIKSGNFEGKLEKDFYGNIMRPLQPVTRKSLVPSTEEIALNNRARSAKLRIAERL